MTLLAHRVRAFPLAVLFIGAVFPALAASSTNHQSMDALSQASEIAEQMSENAPSIDAAEIRKAMSGIKTLDTRLAKALSQDRKKALDALETGIHSAWTAGDRSALGVQAIETYRVLQEAMPRGPKAVPLQVAQLDYVGFKVNALLSQW